MSSSRREILQDQLKRMFCKRGRFHQVAAKAASHNGQLVTHTLLKNYQLLTQAETLGRNDIALFYRQADYLVC